jgi:hypothetical protein
MVAHQHKGVNAPTDARTHFAECPEKAPPVVVIAENRFAAISAVEHVIDVRLRIQRVLSKLSKMNFRYPA